METFHPQNNKQAYLAYAVGLLTDPDALPAPRTNEEVLLLQVCLNGTGGGGIVLPVLANPATAEEILAGYEAIDQEGAVLVGANDLEEQNALLEARLNGDGSTVVVVLPALSNPADPAMILAGYEVIDETGAKQVGAMANRGAVSGAVSPASPEYHMEAGYYADGSVEAVVKDLSVSPSDAEQVIEASDAYFKKVVIAPVATQEKTATPGVQAVVITPDADKFLSRVIIEAILTQAKTATPGTAPVVVTPDEGKYLEEVTIEAVQTQEKIATPGAEQVKVLPDDGKFLSGVTVEAVQTQEKSVTPGDSQVEVTPDAGKFLSRVIVAATSGGGTGNFVITDARDFFKSGYRTEKITQYLPMFQNVTTMHGMFEECRTLQRVDLSSIDTSLVEDMSSMFCECNELSELDLTGWDTSEVTNMERMFSFCDALADLDVSHFNTKRVTSMLHMFFGSGLRRLDMSGWNTGKVTDMDGMFYGCAEMTELIGFSATNKAGMSIGFPSHSLAPHSNAALSRLTFRTDVTNAIRSDIDISYCSFTAEGLAEMFGTLPDISALGLSTNKITITGNPCVTDGSLSDDIRAIATNKGWEIIEEA